MFDFGAGTSNTAASGRLIGEAGTNGDNLPFLAAGGNGGCGPFSVFADLAGLSGNVGPTQPIALEPSSAAIDGALAGTSRDTSGVTLAVDQRGAGPVPTRRRAATSAPSSSRPHRRTARRRTTRVPAVPRGALST